jgi:hypothetical protein
MVDRARYGVGIENAFGSLAGWFLCWRSFLGLGFFGLSIFVFRAIAGFLFWTSLSSSFLVLSRLVLEPGHRIPLMAFYADEDNEEAG